MKKFITYIACATLLLASCTKGFEEMNKNPTTPTGTDIPSLFNGAVSSLLLGWNEQFYLSNEIFYPETELAALSAEAWGNYSIGTEEIWRNYYAGLANINDLSARLDKLCNDSADQEIANYVKAQVIVLKAYKTFKITDIFGDIPYSEAGKIWLQTDNPDYRQPKFDSQESIYRSLLTELVWARDFFGDAPTKTALNHNYYTIPATHDNLFGNNWSSWEVFANALILRHGLRMYDKDPDFAKPLLVKAFSKPEIAAFADICMWPQKLNITNTSAHWSFYEHRNLRMGETAWSRMYDSTSTLPNGIFDYRAYIFFDTDNYSAENPKGKWVPFPQIKDENTPNATGAPYSGSRSSNFWFKPQCNFSPINYYLIRDENYIPEILFTAADLAFIKAEILARNIVPGSAMEIDMMLTSGIKKSFYFWNQMPDNSPIWTETWDAYAEQQQLGIDAKAQNMASYVMNHYYEINGWVIPQEKYLEYIIEQRWINLFRQPWEAWCLARRTFQTPTTTNHAKLKSYRLPYPPSEVEYNKENYLQQLNNMSNGDTRSTKVWWMTK